MKWICSKGLLENIFHPSSNLVASFAVESRREGISIEGPPRKKERKERRARAPFDTVFHIPGTVSARYILHVVLMQFHRKGYCTDALVDETTSRKEDEDSSIYRRPGTTACLSLLSLWREMCARISTYDNMITMGLYRSFCGVIPRRLNLWLGWLHLFGKTNRCHATHFIYILGDKELRLWKAPVISAEETSVSRFCCKNSLQESATPRPS